MADDFDQLLDELTIDLSDVKLLDEGEYTLTISGLKKDQTNPSEKNPDGFPVLVVTFDVGADANGKLVNRKHFQRLPMQGPFAGPTMNLLVCLGLASPEDELVSVKGSDLMGRRMRGVCTHRADKNTDRTYAEFRRFLEALN